MQENELKQCTFLPSDAWMARSLSEPEACSASTVIRLRAYRLNDLVIVAGVVDSHAQDKTVLVDYGASVEAARTRESLRALAAAGIEVRAITGADLLPPYGPKFEGKFGIQHVKGLSIDGLDLPPKAWLGSRNHAKAAQFHIETMIEFQNQVVHDYTNRLMSYGKPERHSSRKSADEADPAAGIELQQFKQRGAKGALGKRALGNMVQQPQQQPLTQP